MLGTRSLGIGNAWVGQRMPSCKNFALQGSEKSLDPARLLSALCACQIDPSALRTL